jgi:hypothetical protein
MQHTKLSLSASIGGSNHILNLFISDKEEACTRLAQLPSTKETEQERLLIADRHVKILTSKIMPCAQVKERVGRVTIFIRGTHVGTGERF